MPTSARFYLYNISGRFLGHEPGTTSPGGATLLEPWLPGTYFVEASPTRTTTRRTSSWTTAGTKVSGDTKYMGTARSSRGAPLLDDAWKSLYSSPCASERQCYVGCFQLCGVARRIIACRSTQRVCLFLTIFARTGIEEESATLLYNALWVTCAKKLTANSFPALPTNFDCPAVSCL